MSFLFPEPGPPWVVLGHSIQGASHQRLDKPNQDAFGSWQPGPGSLPVILAVADGHGARVHCRSQIGARLAVQAALQTLRAFYERSQRVQSLALCHIWAEHTLPRALVECWRHLVDAHLRAQPLSSEERQPFETDARVAYGATVLAALLTPRFWLYLQLGDGDILTVSGQGAVSRPVPHDERLLGNETSSLCMDEAWLEVRVHFAPLEQGTPALVLLSTDGYSNSFQEPRGFDQVGADLLSLLRLEGVAPVAQALGGWLTEASELGSGDDVTVLLAYNDKANS